jgi:hypothetical protein
MDLHTNQSSAKRATPAAWCRWPPHATAGRRTAMTAVCPLPRAAVHMWTCARTPRRDHVAVEERVAARSLPARSLAQEEGRARRRGWPRRRSAAGESTRRLGVDAPRDEATVRREPGAGVLVIERELRGAPEPACSISEAPLSPAQSSWRSLRCLPPLPSVLLLSAVTCSCYPCVFHHRRCGAAAAAATASTFLEATLTCYRPPCLNTAAGPICKALGVASGRATTVEHPLTRS